MHRGSNEAARIVTQALSGGPQVANWRRSCVWQQACSCHGAAVGRNQKARRTRPIALGPVHDVLVCCGLVSGLIGSKASKPD